MTGSSRKGNQSIKAEDAIGFLRDSALITEISGEPALTSKGEMFLNNFKGASKSQSSSSSLGPVSFDGLGGAEGTGQP
jgi:hypothetical protein